MYFIDLLNSKQLLYSSVYSLKLIKLEILKTYTKANLASSFIKSFKSDCYIYIIYSKKQW